MRLSLERAKGYSRPVIVIASKSIMTGTPVISAQRASAAVRAQ